MPASSESIIGICVDKAIKSFCMFLKTSGSSTSFIVFLTFANSFSNLTAAAAPPAIANAIPAKVAAAAVPAVLDKAPAIPDIFCVALFAAAESWSVTPFRFNLAPIAIFHLLAINYPILIRP